MIDTDAIAKAIATNTALVDEGGVEAWCEAREVDPEAMSAAGEAFTNAFLASMGLEPEQVDPKLRENLPGFFMYAVASGVEAERNRRDEAQLP